jgi:hypothetical protein
VNRILVSKVAYKSKFQGLWRFGPEDIQEKGGRSSLASTDFAPFHSGSTSAVFGAR